MKLEVSTTKQPPESSGMEIPDYAIERMAKCLLPLMWKHFEGKPKENIPAHTVPAECVA